MDMESLAKRIYIAKCESKLTNKKVAQKAGISMEYMQQIQGAARVPSLRSFVAICNALKICPSYLLQDSLDVYKEINNLNEYLGLLDKDQIYILKSMAKTMVDKKQEIVV